MAVSLIEAEPLSKSINAPSRLVVSFRLSLPARSSLSDSCLSVSVCLCLCFGLCLSPSPLCFSLSLSLAQRVASQIIDLLVHAVSYSATAPTDSPPFNVFISFGRWDQEAKCST